MRELISQFLLLMGNLAPAVIPLIAVYLGWKLSSLSERRKRSLEVLEKQFEAFRKLKEVLDNIPRGVTGEELAARMKTEPELLDSLKHRLVRLFGLRRELVPHLDQKIASLIDRQFFPLFRCETGSYQLRRDAIEAFAKCCEELVVEIESLKERLAALYRKRIK